MPEELTVDIRPFGPDPAALQQRADNLLGNRALRSALQRTGHQLLSVESLESDKKVARPRAADRFRATIYDYTNNRTLLADGSLRDPNRLEVVESGVQPVPPPKNSRARSRCWRPIGSSARRCERGGSSPTSRCLR